MDEKDDKKRQFKERVEELHKKYCKQLPAKYQEIEDAWNEYKKDLSNLEATDTFYRLVHTLKGTAGTFGFVIQADICFEIQKLLLNVKEEHSVLSDDSVDKIQHQVNQLKRNINTQAKDICS